MEMPRWWEEFFNMSRGERIRLLAAKHQIPPKKADAIALEYSHAISSVRRAIVMALNPGSDSSSASNLLDKVTKVVSELAARHELKEEAVAAFLVDLRLYEGMDMIK